jgi:hypothetical protein
MSLHQRGPVIQPRLLMRVREVGDLLWPQVRVAQLLLPGGVQRELLGLVNLVAALE